MPKNLHGGKHKHLKKEVHIERKITLIEPSDDLMYAYVAKGYGNRNYDITPILKIIKLFVYVPNIDVKENVLQLAISLKYHYLIPSPMNFMLPKKYVVNMKSE